MKLFRAILCTASILAGSGVFSSCSHDHAGVETTNGIQVAITLQNGSPAAGARIRVIATQDWSNRIVASQTVVLDSGTANLSGVATLTAPDSGFALEIQSDSQSIRQFVPLREQCPASLTLSSSGSVTGEVVGPFTPFSEVRLAGTSFTTKLDSTGHFFFPQIPTGNYTATSQLFTAPVQSKTGAPTLTSIVTNSATQFLLDDFEDLDRYHRFAPVTGGGVWFWSFDSNSAILELPSFSNPDFSSALTDSSAWNGASVHLHFAVDNSVSGSFANIGVNFLDGEDAVSSRREWIDLCGLDTLAFMAKGQGTALLQFVTPLNDQNPAHPVLYGTLVDLDSNWTRIAIPADQIVPMDGRLAISEAPSWPNSCSQVRGITFTFDADAEFWLDDLTLIGNGVNSWVLDSQ